MNDKNKTSRRDAILMSLAQMLETNPGKRITTASLARQVGVSEAALYRHFPSKAKMYEALIDFVEDSLFSRINQILRDQTGALVRCEQILALVLTFAARNPGLCRLLTGEVLVGENDRLRVRVAKIFERLETELRQVLRGAEIHEGLVTKQPASSAANLLSAYVEGLIGKYVRSNFRQRPDQYWPDQWTLLCADLLHTQKYS